MKKDTVGKVHINLFNIEINNGTFRYVEKVTPIDYTIIDVYLKTDAIRWNSDTITVSYAFKPQSAKGDINGQFIINGETNDFQLAVLAKQLDMQIFEQYLKAFSKRVRFSSNLDADIKASGNFKNSEALNATGTIAINDLHVGEKNKKEDYISFNRLKVDIVQLNPGEKRYAFDSVVLAEPFVKYEVYDTTLDNSVSSSEGSRLLRPITM